MKSLLLSTLLVLTGASAVAVAQDPGIQELRAVEVNYYGGITGFDRAGYRTLQSSMASLIVDGTVAHYITTAVGLEGGSTFCVELSGNPTLKVNAITDVLDTIKPSVVTVYSYNLLKTCLN